MNRPLAAAAQVLAIIAAGCAGATGEAAATRARSKVEVGMSVADAIDTAYAESGYRYFQAYCFDGPKPIFGAGGALKADSGFELVSGKGDRHFTDRALWLRAVAAVAQEWPCTRVVVKPAALHHFALQVKDGHVVQIGPVEYGS
jgi:hypothetical protein